MENVNEEIVEQSEVVAMDNPLVDPSVAMEDSAEQQTKDETFGKFASADELWKAYNVLQGEFTRKSQELSQHRSGAAGKPVVSEIPALLGAGVVAPSAPGRARTLRESDALAYKLFEQVKGGKK